MPQMKASKHIHLYVQLILDKYVSHPSFLNKKNVEKIIFIYIFSRIVVHGNKPPLKKKFVVSVMYESRVVWRHTEAC